MQTCGKKQSLESKWVISESDCRIFWPRHHPAPFFTNPVRVDMDEREFGGGLFLKKKPRESSGLGVPP
jgi:hypothetical protein